MIRRRSTPWIQRWSRQAIAAIATCGALTTAYLTFEKLTGGNANCVAQAGVKGCNDVLSSPWGTVFGQPLALFGFLAYTSMLIFALAPLAIKGTENKEKRQKLENVTWLLLLAGAIAMTVFSGYLMYVLAFELKAICPYCIGSALFSLSLLVLTLIGHVWEDLGQIFFTAIIVGMVTLIGTLGVYAGVNPSGAIAESTDGKPVQISFTPKVPPNPEFGWEITTKSGKSELALARHLAKIGAKEYSAYWCPHCHEQKLLFGKEAQEIIETNNIKVECAGDSPKGKPELCKAAKVEGFPTWIVNGKSYGGVQNLQELATNSGYTGSVNFKYFK
ncbi:vitamin K epoxide reductase family protein [Plectonema radiosum NIES-515]|uniref:Vitamin K epoxide reductase family protein n=1 Tax=Plectonema radiosum NIES-515 TaxID=2986073 RepID=A0ABT3B3X3_9CYAN|nr:vitamin K epoxide reductase family protein [Plectonema radiosum]MCV3216062.1 vitamin K epoxide reductase family protein [Plectonema radiosum NIES-515]